MVMDDDVKDKVVAVVDNGLFLALAVRLAREFGHVLYHQPLPTTTPTVGDMVLGDGIEGIQQIERLYDHLDDIDLFVFPDILRSDLQVHLENLGKRVWGSRYADELELNRVRFRQLQAKIGLEYPVYQEIRGLSALRGYLEDYDDLFVKVSSRYRGSMETWHHTNIAHSRNMLDSLAMEFGAVQDEILFIVEEPVDSELEDGLDTFTVDGQFPEEVCQGYEIKNKGIIMSVRPWSEQPKQITDIAEALAPTIKQYRCRNFFSMEVRIKGECGICLEPTMRAPDPGIGAQMELIDNLGEIMWHGANGDLVQPKFNAKFAIQCAIIHDHAKEHWRTITVPEAHRDRVKLVDFCEVDGAHHLIPRAPFCEKIGWVVGTGDSLDAAIDQVMETTEALKDNPVAVQTESIVDALKEIQEAEKQNVEFSEQTVPAPEEAI